MNIFCTRYQGRVGVESLQGPMAFIDSHVDHWHSRYYVLTLKYLHIYKLVSQKTQSIAGGDRIISIFPCS